MMNKNLSRSVQDIDLNDIIVSKANTRAFYDEEALAGLATSVGTVGQIYPVVLRRINDTKYELIIGTRRLRAQQKIKAKTIPAFVIEEINDKDVVILALAENLHREDLTIFEEAKGILKLCKDFGMTHKQVAERIGKEVTFVTGRLKILSLPDEVQDMLSKGGVIFSHVDLLSSLKKSKDQIRYAKLVAKQKLSQEDLRTLIQEEVKSRPAREQVPRLFGAKKTAIKVKRFNKFLNQKVRPRLAVGDEETREIRSALRQVRRTIKELLGHKPQLTQKQSS